MRWVFPQASLLWGLWVFPLRSEYYPTLPRVRLAHGSTHTTQPYPELYRSYCSHQLNIAPQAPHLSVFTFHFINLVMPRRRNREGLVSYSLYAPTWASTAVYRHCQCRGLYLSARLLHKGRSPQNCIDRYPYQQGYWLQFFAMTRFICIAGTTLFSFHFSVFTFHFVVEIAEALGYKDRSTVNKILKKLRG